ncbi:TetR/AcrR family transcriptional regulator [Cohnella cholangitidis]|uniref:TetR/AcrR family transcriptional regulator n=1 Tax=Cohnella cholangitidis TaxID=2598458 RepID=A0A7G5C0M3_9BACL|nr:TetR/AcrR family transcriptional regulator [Cohnella cholangitidis]QMV42757.1 TetR/AcrR family transcriptional regulator [Cohnella cholangitidis]
MVKGRSDGEETKKRITNKAKHLFIQKGYGAVTMNEVCEEAGVSKGSLYHHFPSKDELFLFVIEEDSEHWQNEWNKKRATLNGIEEQMYALAEHYANDFQNPLLKAMEEFSRSRVITDDVFERVLRIGNNSSQACRDVLREGMESGDFAEADLDEQVLIVSSMFEGLGKIYYMIDREQEQNKVRDYYEKAVRLMLDGIRAKAK